jgi:hypothetical protein
MTIPIGLDTRRGQGKALAITVFVAAAAVVVAGGGGVVVADAWCCFILLFFILVARRARPIRPAQLYIFRSSG